MNFDPTTPSDAGLSQIAAPARVNRVVSLDIFRGITMAVMIFVNDLSGAQGLPWWTFHAHAQEDVMTYVDMVFPFFLFIVGMSLPLSIAQRLKKNPSIPALCLHVLIRTLSLLVLGLILANAEKADAIRMGFSGMTWGCLSLLSAALFLNIYPKSTRFPSYAIILRTIGFAGVVILFALFKGTTEAHTPTWIDFSYPEILGLIAFSYLASAILYIPTRRWAWAQEIWFVASLAFCALATARVITYLPDLSIYIWPFSNGAMVCLVMAGVVTTNFLLKPGPASSNKKGLLYCAIFAVLCLVAGWLLTPLGISKIRATPTWTLYSAGAAILFIVILYWICDVKGHTAWAFLFKSAGSNTLLTYLLPDFWFYVSAMIGFTYLDTHLAAGWPAVVKTLAFTVVILAISAGFTRLKIRLQL